MDQDFVAAEVIGHLQATASGLATALTRERLGWMNLSGGLRDEVNHFRELAIAADERANEARGKAIDECVDIAQRNTMGPTRDRVLHKLRALKEVKRPGV
jgi:hypothetical protein